MLPVTEFFLTALGGFIAASSGFWVYLRRRDEAKSAHTMLLMGLAQDKITYLGMKYIARGWVTYDDYEHLRRYLYEPYVRLGGNGTTEKIMRAVEELPLRGNILDSLTLHDDKFLSKKDIHDTH